MELQPRGNGVGAKGVERPVTVPAIFGYQMNTLEEGRDDSRLRSVVAGRPATFALRNSSADLEEGPSGNSNFGEPTGVMAMVPILGLHADKIPGIQERGV